MAAGGCRPTQDVPIRVDGVSFRSESRHLRRWGWPQSFNDPAFSDSAAIAGIYHRLQFPSQSLKISDLAIHLHQMLVGDTIDPGTVATLVVGKAQERAHLIQREAQITGPPDKRQAGKLSLPIVAIVARRAGGLRQQANLLLIADRLDLRVCALAHFPDR